MSDKVHVKWRFKMSGSSKVMTCGMDFVCDDEIVLQDLVDIVAAADEGWDSVNVMSGRFTADVLFLGSKAFAYDVVANPDFPAQPPPFLREITLGPAESVLSEAGTHLGSCLPPNNAVVCSFRTILSSRRTRGRIYLPPMPESEVDARGSIDDATATGWGDDIEAWIDHIEAALSPTKTLTHVVRSLQEADLATTVVDYDVGERIDTQRRRLERSLET